MSNSGEPRTPESPLPRGPDRFRPVWRLVTERVYRGFRLLVRENVEPAARALMRDINTYFPERRWSFVPSPRGWFVFCASHACPTRWPTCWSPQVYAHRSHAAEGAPGATIRCSRAGRHEPWTSRRCSFTGLQEQVDRYLAARAVLAERLLRLCARERRAGASRSSL